MGSQRAGLIGHGVLTLLGLRIAMHTRKGGKVENNMPDAYMAQDLENQFKTIFFQNGDYAEPAIVVPMITGVGAIEPCPHISDHQKDSFSFSVTQIGDVNETHILLEYNSLDEAQLDRAKLLSQIESYHARGIYHDMLNLG